MFSKIGGGVPQKLTTKILKNLLRGTILCVPIGITVFVGLWLFDLLDKFLPNIIQFILNIIFAGKVTAPYIPGLGLIAMIILLSIIGYFSDFLITNRLLRSLDTYLEKAPGIKILYTTGKDLIKNLAGSSKKFHTPVLVNLEDKKNVYQIGFITQEDLTMVGLDDYVSVYVPMSFSVAGNIYFVSRKQVTILPDIDSASAMKFMISGGVSNLSTKIKTELN